MRAIVLALGLLAAPAMAQSNSSSAHRLVKAPPVGATRTASAGEPIFSAEDTLVSSTTERKIRLNQKIKIGNLMKGVIIIPEDSDFVERSDGGAIIACTKLNMLFGKNKPCLYDATGDGVFDQVSFGKDEAPKPLDKPAPYTVSVSTQTDNLSPKFRSVVTYSGSNGSSILLSYREFSNDMARPAFSEELQVPIGKDFPQRVRFKGVTIQINKIDGMGMNYTILES